MTAAGRVRAARSPLQLAGHLVVRLIRMEIGVWRSLYRWIFRRPRVPRGAVGFSYDRPIRPILLAFLVVSAIEIPVLDLLVHRWPAVRIPLLIAGIWGLTWMLGLLLGFLVRPHAVGPDGLRVRHGDEVDIVLPWEVVESVAPRARSVESSKTFTVTDGLRGGVLTIAVQNETNVEVVLEEPVVVSLPRGTETVTELRFRVDDPRGYLAEVRRHLAPETVPDADQGRSR
jgi:hypothetical protein